MATSGPPKFLRSLPVITEIAPGDILTFQVQVDCEPHRVAWLHCGEVVLNSARKHVTAHPNGWHELVIGNASEEDEGEYECRVEASDGQSASCFTDVYFVQDDNGSRDQSEGSGPAEADVRGIKESGLLILIDDGSDEDEQSGNGAESVGSRKRTLTASEQFQGFLDEISRKGDDDDEDSFTLEEEEFDEELAIGGSPTRPQYCTQVSSTSQGSSTRHPNICDAFSDLEAPIGTHHSSFTSTISSAQSSTGTLMNEELSSSPREAQGPLETMEEIPDDEDSVVPNIPAAEHSSSTIASLQISADPPTEKLAAVMKDRVFRCASKFD
ncbi:uncharacterized protein LOC114828624 [Galendromus occidentalis]|uniref:Uncharacterized protein LOC114828624 n=1 Tax=Galendromus occidentalis TaxID=34638 RepID=A0AAJ7SJE8_9ACAR|nr:uncharacterized protein LOC114828624 [Galendromus occidentalis]